LTGIQKVAVRANLSFKLVIHDMLIQQRRVIVTIFNVSGLNRQKFERKLMTFQGKDIGHVWFLAQFAKHKFGKCGKTWQKNHSMTDGSYGCLSVVRTKHIPNCQTLASQSVAGNKIDP
jgi:hypothetical protein